MANVNGKSYGLTLLCPIRTECEAALCPVGLEGQSCAALIRFALQQLKVNQESPMSKVPNTYLSRLFVLDDISYQGKPASLEHLKSSYLVFASNFHGELDVYLRGMWKYVRDEINAVLQYCVGFETVKDEATYLAYIKRCQVTTTFFFNGSSDEPLAEQLKGLYLKQELSQFAYANQGRTAAELQTAFQEFVRRTKPADTKRPTWKAGAYHLDKVVAP